MTVKLKLLIPLAPVPLTSVPVWLRQFQHLPGGFSQALIAQPKERNEVSGLMIMGLFGGTIFPLAMGFADDAFGQIGAVGVMTVGVAYLLCYTLKIKSTKN